MQPRIAFIGAGNMAQAIIGGLINNGYPKKRIIAADPFAQSLEKAQQLAIATTSDNAEAISGADIIVLAVKPQLMHDVCQAISPAVQTQKPLVISIAAGITEPLLNEWLGGELAIVRCMPNTPALVQTGATAYFANSLVSTQQQLHTEQLLKAIGIVEKVASEDLLDAVTAVSGSGPAYFFLLLEAMQQAGVKLGLSPEVAKRLSEQTALGAAKMAQQSEFSAQELRQQVTSPNGTTEAAIKALQAGDFETLVQQALNAADTRSKSLVADLTKG